MQTYTEKAEQALRTAKKVSAQLDQPYTGTEHILIGLLRGNSSAAGQVLSNAGVTEKGLVSMISQLIAQERKTALAGK